MARATTAANASHGFAADVEPYHGGKKKKPVKAKAPKPKYSQKKGRK